MASRPVSWIAATIDEGAAVPVTDISWALRSADTSLMPVVECQPDEMFIGKRVGGVQGNAPLTIKLI